MAIKKEDVTESVILKVRGLDNAVIRFKISKRTYLMKLIKSYCLRVGLAMTSVTFKFNGRVIGKTDNALSMNMGTGDIIQVYRKPIKRE